MSTKHTLFAAVGLSMACAGGPAVEINQNPDVPAERWQGAIASPPNLAGAVQMDGTAWMAAGDAANETHVQVEIENAAPGGTHPWVVQRGRCGSQGSLFGTPDDYEPIQVGDDGSAEVSTDVEMTLPMDGEYSVQVLASPTNMDLVVACANLAPPVRDNAFD
jgi:hypothetical protein